MHKKLGRLIALGFVMSFAHCFPTLQAGTTQEITIGVSKLRDFFDPAYASGVGTAVILQMLHSNLVKLNAFGFVTADLADTWRVSRDFRNYSFCMRSKSFSDGSTIGLDDIQYSLERIEKIEGNKSLLKGIFSSIKPTVVSDPVYEATARRNAATTCFTILLKKPYKDFIYILASPYLSIVPNNSNKHQAIGAGQFILDKFDPLNREMRFKRRVASQEKPAYFVFREVPFSREINEYFDKNQMHLYLGADDYQLLPIKGKSHKTLYVDSLAVSHLLLNMKSPLFQNHEFRRDIARLIQSIANRNLPGKYPFEYQPHLIPLGLMPYEYYVNREHLNFSHADFEKKWSSRFNGQRLRVLGTINQFNKATVHELSETLKSVNLRFEYISDYYGKTLEYKHAGDYEMSFLGWFGVIANPEAYVRIYETTAFDNQQSQQILRRYRSDLDVALAEQDSKERGKKIGAVVRRLESEYLVIPLFKTHSAIVVSDEIVLPETKFKYLLDFSEIKFKQIGKRS